LTRFHFIRPQGDPTSGELPSIHLAWIGIPIIGYGGGVSTVNDETYVISGQRRSVSYVISGQRGKVDYEDLIP